MMLKELRRGLKIIINCCNFKLIQSMLFKVFTGMALDNLAARNTSTERLISHKSVLKLIKKILFQKYFFFSVQFLMEKVSAMLS
jgi:hypothetical protein